MDTQYCNPKSCDRKETCNHHIVKPTSGTRVPEDLSDICLPDYWLYIKGDYYKGFPNKAYYVELLNFYDNKCPGQNCGQRAIHNQKLARTSRIECNLGIHYTCNHPDHPTNNSLAKIMKLLQAESEAIEQAGIEEGTVTYTCPICGNEAIANTYKYAGKTGRLGSGCPHCGISHS
jgi:predicted RNA-binding Zn-ribbon protein involved in translation (DUF1610 family)